MRKKNILFVCRYNRFRSRVAEAYFNKINKNKNVVAKSAGLIRGRPVDKKQASVAASKENKLNIVGRPQGLSSKLMAWQKIAIIVANDVPEQVFDRNKEYGKEVVVWEIPDAKGDDKEEINKIISKIKSKVEELVKKLK